MRDFFCNEGSLQPADAVAAIILVDGEHYLMQLRDQKHGIFYPGHWGLFGGALEQNESAEQALQRELEEELGLVVKHQRHLTDLSFTFGRFGRIARHFFEVSVRRADVEGFVLNEGRAMQVFAAPDILRQARIVPYDAFAIWMHFSRVLD